MRTRHAVFILCLINYVIVQSQEYRISGKVMDQNQVPIPFANVLLFTAPDSTYVGGTSADDDGKFLITADEGLYTLFSTYLGNNSQQMFLDIREDVKIGALIIEETAQTLDEVVVTAKKPTLTRTEDRLIFKVENTVLSQGTSWDILKATPGVVLNQDEFLIKGSSATVFLNDRQIKLTSDEIRALLEGLSGANIESVEVMANPPAQYDAEAGPILNIKTSSAVVPGYKGSVNGSYTQAIAPKYTLGTSHYYKSGDFNFFANYNAGIRKRVITRNRNINFLDAQNQPISIWDSDGVIEYRDLSHNGLVNMDYQFDQKNNLNITSNVLLNNGQEGDIGLNTTIRNAQQVLDSSFTTIGNSLDDDFNISTDVTFTHQMKNPGSKWTLNGHYTRYTNEGTSSNDSRYFDANNNFERQFAFRTNSERTIDIFTTQMDWVLPLAKGTFEWGGKYSYVKADNSILFDDFQGQDNLVNASLNDRFIYDESIIAGYVQWARSWEDFSLKLGVRTEYTDAVGTSLTLSEVNTQDFLEPFPSLFMKYNLSEASSMSFDYRRNLRRPNYSYLNPFRTFFNENDFDEGNPTLQPAFINRFNLNYSLNDEFFIDVYYRDNGRYIQDNVFQDNTNFDIRKLYQNMLESTSYGLDFTLSKGLLDFWYIYSYVSIFHEDGTFIAEESGNIPFKNEYDGWYGYLANYFTLSGDGTFNGEITATYLSGFLFGSFIMEEQFNLTVGLSKSFMDNKLSISVAAEDFFRTNAPAAFSRYLNQDNQFRYIPETRFIRLGLTYNFGNSGLERTEKEIDKNELDRLED